MTPDTEALRAQFERRMNLRGWPEANIRRDGLDYSSTQITEAWHAFQAGYAAAKAETAAVGARGISLARELRDQADFDEAESVFGGGSRTRELMREAADALHAGAEERGE